MNSKPICFTAPTILFALFAFASCSKEGHLPKKEDPAMEELTKISVSSPPEKTIYTLGEPLSLKGLAVEGIYKDNSRKKLDVTEKNISGFSSGKPSDDLVLTVTVDKFSATFSVKVLPVKVENGVLTQAGPNITHLVLPDYVKAIGNEAFQHSKITSITLNEGLVSIGESAFAWSQITDIKFPKTLNNIDKWAFYGCNKLKAVDLSQTALSKIVRETFTLNSSLATIKLPAGVKEIEAQAFLGSTSLEELSLPEGLLKVGNEAFRESGIVNLRLPNSIYYMGERAFYLCDKLQRVETFGGTTPDNNGTEIRMMRNSTFENCPELAYFEIPESVQILGQNTVAGSPKLTSIVIPSSVKEIKFNAFRNTALETVAVKGSTPAKAGTVTGTWYAFPPNLQTIKVPSGSSAAYKAAEGWKEYEKQITE